MTFATSLLDHPTRDAFVDWPQTLGRRFMLWIDTEEEFDWMGPFDRGSRSVSVIAGMARFQDYMVRAGVKPVYVTDHAVADSDAACDLMRGWLAAGTADVGAHLHPWINPPHEEVVNLANSFAGNLPPELERAKLFALRDRIEERLGVRPIAFRAGRYGIGPQSAAALEEAGFRVDSSVRARFNYASQRGPDFRGKPLHPWRAGPTGKLIELPLSTAYVGAARLGGDRLHELSQRHGLLSGGLSRLGLFARVPLTPEGVTAQECMKAIDALIADDVPLLMFSFHSPTLEPGHTPYARKPADVERFYAWWDEVLAHLAARGVQPLALDELVAAL